MNEKAREGRLRPKIASSQHVKNFKIEVFLRAPFGAVENVNFGMILIGAYILMDFGSITGLYSFLNYELRLPFIISALTVLYALFLILTNRIRLFAKSTKYFTLIGIYVVIYALLDSKLPGSGANLVKSFSCYLSLYYIFLYSIKDLKQYVFITDVWIAAIGFSCYHGIMQGGLVWGNKYIRDENELALLASIALPVTFVLFIEFKSKIKRICYLFCLVLFITAVVISHSRGGMLSLATAGIFCVYYSKRKMLAFLAMALAILMIISYAPEKFFQELYSLRYGTEEKTAASRIYFWEKAYEMWRDNPLLGVGPRNYPYYFPIYDKGERYGFPVMRPAHSFPVEWAAELGSVGIFLLIGLQTSLYKNWRRRTHGANAQSDMDQGTYSFYKNIFVACMITQLTFWVGSMFLSLMSYPFYWFSVFFCDTLYKIGEGSGDTGQKNGRTRTSANKLLTHIDLNGQTNE